MSWILNPLLSAEDVSSVGGSAKFRWPRRLPLYLQTEAAECGLACLAMVASFHGYRVDLNTLRRRFPVSLKGVTLKALMQVAKQLQLSCRPLRFDLDTSAAAAPAGHRALGHEPFRGAEGGHRARGSWCTIPLSARNSSQWPRHRGT